MIETRDAEGNARSTHLWYAEPNGELWLEAGAPENGWFRDIQSDPTVVFRTGERATRFVAEPSSAPKSRPI